MISIKLTCFYSRNSFESVYLNKDEVKSWIDEIKDNSSDDIRRFLVGTKSDLEEERQVESWEGEMLKNKYNLDEFMEVSAQDGTNTKELFLKAVMLLLKQSPDSKRNSAIPKSTTISDIQNSRTIPDLDSLMVTKKKSCSCCELLYILGS